MTAIDFLLYWFAGIGVLVTVWGLYLFAKDQYAIWEMNTYERLKKKFNCCLLYTSPSPRDRQKSRMPSSA